MENTEQEIQRIREIIRDFARKDLYSANCIEVKMLYRRLRELENRPQHKEEDFTEKWIDESDVPVNGRYE